MLMRSALVSKLTSKQQRILAHHEAGHAVVARVLGVGISYASLFPIDPQSKANVVTASASWLVDESDVQGKIAALEKDAKVAFAGAHAQHTYYPLTESEFRRAINGDWAVDWKNASAYVRMTVMLKNMGKIDQDLTFGNNYARDATELAERLLEEAATVVLENWQAIERVATALLSKPFLTQDDIDALVDGRRNLDDLINRKQEPHRHSTAHAGSIPILEPQIGTFSGVKPALSQKR
jgi:ATP-dependent Zn protease